MKMLIATLALTGLVSARAVASPSPGPNYYSYSAGSSSSFDGY
jgi:hypothetical protein